MENNILNEFSKIKELMIKSIPSIELFLKKDKDWDKLSSHYYTKYINLVESGKEILSSDCFLDVFLLGISVQPERECFKTIIRCICDEINKAVSFFEKSKREDLKSGINDIIRQMLTTMDVDPKSNNSDFKNRLAELMVFNSLCNAPVFEILLIEGKLGNGKSCDFVVKTFNDEILYLEVFTIQHIDVSKQDDSETMSDFINYKIENKYNDKLAGIQMQNFFVVPVLDYTDGLSKFKIDTNRSISWPPMTIIQESVAGIVTCKLVHLDDLTK